MCHGENPDAHIHEVIDIHHLRRLLAVRLHLLVAALGLDVAESLRHAHAQQVEHLDAVQVGDVSHTAVGHRQHLTVDHQRHHRLAALLHRAKKHAFRLVGHRRTVSLASLPALQFLLEETVGQEVVLFADVICRLLVEAVEPLQRHLLPCLHVLARLGIDEVADTVVVRGVYAEALQPSEDVVADALEVADARLQVVLRVSLQAVAHVHVRRVVAHRHHRHDTLAVRIRQVVNTRERVALLDQHLRRIWPAVVVAHLRGEVRERHPVQPVAVLVGLAPAANIRDEQLIRLRDISVTPAHHVVLSLVLLHHDTVVLAEVHEPASVVRREPHLARLRIIVVHLHHRGEDAVVVLAQQLRDDHLEHAEGVAYHGVVDLQRILILYDPGRVHELLLLYRPSLTAEEVRHELRTGEISRERRVAFHLQSREHTPCLVTVYATVADLRMLTDPQILQLCNALLGDDTALQAFSIFAEDDRAQSNQAFHEGGLVEHLIEYDLVELTRHAVAQQIQEGRTNAYSRILGDPALVADHLEFLL